MISCRIEQVFISELAYAADYVISRKGNIESPAFVSHSLFPQNYNDFIMKNIMKNMMHYGIRDI